MKNGKFALYAAATLIFLMFLIPKVYKNQVAELFAPSFEKVDNLNYTSFHDSSRVDFTSNNEILFVCFAPNETSANISAQRFASKNNFKYKTFFDFIGHLSFLSSFYFIDRDGNVKVSSFYDKRRHNLSSQANDRSGMNKVSGHQFCHINNKPINIFFDDT